MIDRKVEVARGCNHEKVFGDSGKNSGRHMGGAC